MTTGSSTPLITPPIHLLKGASLFLDFDGTIVPIVERPDAVETGDKLIGLLSLLGKALDGRLAIVTGRAAREASALLRAPPFPIVGSHGLEILWPDGRQVTASRPDHLSTLAMEMNALKQRYPYVLVEEKPFGVALHYRLAPQAEDDCRELAMELANRTGLTIQPGKMVFELRLPGANKGSAVSTLMAGRDMAGTIPIFIGDDVTDEAGFGAAKRLGGAGILVGPERPTLATYRLNDVNDVMGWLNAASEA